MPRFGHGAFLLCLENLYKKVDTATLIQMDVCRFYVDIMTGGSLLSIRTATSPVIDWSVRSSSRRGMGCGKRGGVVILARYEFLFIRVHDNLV